uniref:Uncharacterized protein n=1 Tax=Oryza brachyantha TaxID=4533 RepID=J3L1P2_ORYBR
MDGRVNGSVFRCVSIHNGNLLKSDVNRWARQSVEAWLGVGHLDADAGAANLGGEQSAEPVEVAPVEVVGDPGAAVASELVDGGDERRAEEETQREHAQEEATAHGLHPLRALVDEEVEMADVGEGLV